MGFPTTLLGLARPELLDLELGRYTEPHIDRFGLVQLTHLGLVK